jgi:hypothetical protein
MDPITRDDDELFGTVMVAARLGRADAIVTRLREHYEKEWDDPRAGFPYALAMLALLQSGREDLREQLNYTEIVETLSDLLYHEPDHWLGRYLRIHTRTLLPVNSTEHQGYITAERTRAAEDVAELIERQAATDWRPWFACPYVLAARLAWEADDRDRVPGLVSAAAARPGAPVPFRALGGLLCEGFIWYDAQPDLPERATAGAVMDALFADQPAVRRVRKGRLV